MQKTILITGATAGIGLATAHLFAKHNWRVITTGRRKERLLKQAAELKTKYDAEILPLAFDIQDKKAVEKALASLKQTWQNIDVLVNNAGLALGREPIHEADTQDWDTMIDTNIKGLLYITQPIAKQMKARGAGHIINLSSIAAKEVYPNGNVYCATKHAVDALTKGMRLDLLPYGIKVSSIAPGMVETEFSDVRYKGDSQAASAVYQGFTPLYAEDVADVIYFAATRPAHVCVNDLLLMATDQGSAQHVRKNI